ncbi:unnamed protein product [Prunus brigantina]
MCLLFPSTLSGAALNWFYRLNHCTINTFDSLKQAFLDHFMIQIDRLYSADDLYMLRQGEDEPLREYAARFSHEYSRCLDTDDRAAFGAFKSGLRESNFRYLRGPATPARNPFANPPPTSAPTPALPQHSTLAPRRIATSIPSTITSGADMATTTSPAEATHTGQVIGLHSPSHPSLGSRCSPP